MIDIEAIKQRVETWREAFVFSFSCQECGAGQDGHPSPSDIDVLIAEVERLTTLVTTHDSFHDTWPLRCIRMGPIADAASEEATFDRVVSNAIRDSNK